MQLNDITGEKAVQTLGVIMEPAIAIIKDKKVEKLANGDKTKLVAYVLKKHYHQVFLIMAALHQQDPKDYKPNILELPMDLMDMLNDPDLSAIFFSQEQSGEETPSGSVSETSEDGTGKTE